MSGCVSLQDIGSQVIVYPKAMRGGEVSTRKSREGRSMADEGPALINPAVFGASMPYLGLPSCGRDHGATS
jgi:hypothetical protein